MSGGHFVFNKYDILDIISELEDITVVNERGFSEDTISYIKDNVKLLEGSLKFITTMDKLLSGDISEDSINDI